MIAPLAFVIANLIIYWSGWSVTWKLMLAVLLGLVLLGLTMVLSPAGRRPELDRRMASWLPPCLLGMTALSYFGAKDFGGIGLLPFGWDALAVAVFSVLVYAPALALRLPDAAARRYMGELGAEAEAEAELLSERSPA